MKLNSPQFSILITTKNRLSDLKKTLENLIDFIQNKNVEFIICDDGSTDGTTAYIKSNYPSIQLINNSKSKGLIFSRNRLLNLTKSKYAITLDDDADIVSQNTLERIESYFNNNQKCAVMAFRIFWGKVLPENLSHSQSNEQVKSFVGCGHAWRIDAWKVIPNYPDWFVFYGEEDFASYQLFKKGWEVHYTPDVLVHHRVDVKIRKKQKDYRTRLRRSLRSGWYLYVLFYPLHLIPRRFFYTLWVQIRTKVIKGNVKALIGIFGAIFNLIFNMPRLIYNRRPLTKKEFECYNTIPNAFIYWEPKKRIEL